jgi:phospholipid transport system transporter-binding protein
MIEALGAGIQQVSGPLTYATVAAVRARSLPLIARGQTVTFDLASVPAVDSAALALVVEWLRAGAARGVEVRLRSVPAPLRDLARVCGCDELLPELGAA